MTKLFPLRLKRVASAVVLFAALLALAPHALAQSASAPASVTGRVTDGERGMQGVTVAVLMSDPAQRFKTAARAKTDADGRYLIQNVPPGRYQIVPFAPAYVLSGVTEAYPPGRPLTLLSGDEAKDVDFRLDPGAVITGRVTDAEGEPVVAESVSVELVEETGRPPRPTLYDQRDMTTDDRGVYRLYGLPPGRYRVSVGRADAMGAINYGRRKIFRRTFYPDATEAADARIVEVKAGQEATDVDITVGRALKTYRASGVFVSAETGQPVPDVAFAYSTVDARGRITNIFGRGETTNTRGEFHTEGLVPGRYTIFAAPSGQQSNSGVYSDPTAFEVADADVTNVVVKVKRGATVSGFVTIEGTTDRAALASTLAAVRVYAWTDSPDRASPPYTSSAQIVGADGSFTLTGLRPGRVRIGYGGQIKGLMLKRVDLNGANTGGSIDVPEGAQIGGIHLVLAYGTASITGQTTFANGTMAPGERAVAQARRVGGNPGEANIKTAEVDMRGYFRIEGLPGGDYDVFVLVFGAGSMHRGEPQRVTLADGGEARVSPVVDLSVVPPPPPPRPKP